MDEIELALARVYQEARTQRNSYFEKLALLDGGTVALIITAVLGPLHGQVQHKYILGVGLSLLVLSMLTLLRRNYLAVEIEFHSAARTTMDVQFIQDPEAQKRSHSTMGGHTMWL
jgi:hypothetical protein